MSMVNRPERGWNGWYHCTGSTFGTWIRGDPRGWPARHHREHVDGDYKRPPKAGAYDKLHRASKGLMRRERVVLSHEARAFAADEFVRSLTADDVELIAVCISAKHWHVLARFAPPDAAWVTADRMGRRLIGRAKGRSAVAMGKAGLVAEGGVWAKRCRIKPIADRRHQLRVARYIPAYKKKGAAVRMLLKNSRANPPG